MPRPHTHTVTLFDCRNLGIGCSQCLASSLGSEFTCGWCDIFGRCEEMQECINKVFITEGRNCPATFIESISPDSGNPNITNLYVTTVPIYNLYVISDVGSNFSMGGSSWGKKIRRAIDKLSLLTCLEGSSPWSPSPFLLHWS